MVNVMSGRTSRLARTSRVSGRDRAGFVGRVVVCAALATGGGALALLAPWPLRIVGYVVLAAMFVHAVELQHQVLHHTAFVNQRPHRPVGVVLGLPMMVNYTHYRLKHLQHHKYLGTDRDTEFFQFDTRQPLTPARLLRATFHYGRWLQVLKNCVTSYTGTWKPDFAGVPERMADRIRAEYRLLGGIIVVVTGLSVATGSLAAVHLWVIPLLLAEPLHFLVELPEHVFCENDTQDVMRNTRTIAGSRFSTWFTNSNNLHVEHHWQMTVPMQNLPEIHPDLAPKQQYLCRTYWDFYRSLLTQVLR